MKKGSGLLLELLGARWIPEDHGSGRLPVIMGFFYFICGRKRKEKERGKTNRETGGKDSL